MAVDVGWVIAVLLSSRSFAIRGGADWVLDTEVKAPADSLLPAAA
jgi:hypothetical protein